MISSKNPLTPYRRNIFRRLVPGFVLAISWLCFTSLPAEEERQDELSATVAEDFDSLFEPESRGFLGADGAASVALSENRFLWIFGDTIIGSVKEEKRHGPMIRNSIAILTLKPTGEKKVEYFWNLEDKIPGAFFHPEDWQATHWYWPGCGIKEGGKVYLFLTKLIEPGNQGAFNFSTVGCDIFTIHNPQDNPEQWRVTRRDFFPANDRFNINAAALVQNDYVYLLGYHDGEDGNTSGRKSILARFPVEDLEADDPAARLEFWSEGESWDEDHDSLAYLFDYGATETSLHFDPVREQYLTVIIKPFKPGIYISIAKEITGPWSEPRLIYRMSEMAENELFHGYAGRAHPELSSDPDELLITYVVNTSDFWSMFDAMDIYYPRFIRLKFENGQKSGGSGATNER